MGQYLFLIEPITTWKLLRTALFSALYDRTTWLCDSKVFIEVYCIQTLRICAVEIVGHILRLLLKTAVRFKIASGQTA